MEKGINWKKGLEISLGLVMVFVAIMVVFGVLHFGFNFLRNSISGNIISQETAESIGNFNWVIVSILTSIVTLVALKKVVKKDLFKINWD